MKMWTFSVFIIFFTTNLVSCLYEDQIGKFDWKQSYIGIPKYAHIEAVGDKIIVATKENVVAMLNGKTGELESRFILESNPRGEILLLAGSSEPTGSHLTQQFDTITVSGRNPSIIRGWNMDAAAIEFEWSLNLLNPNVANDVLWFYHKHFLYHVVPVWGSHLEITEYLAQSGQTTKNTASKITAAWIKKNDCLLVKQYFTCVAKNQLLILDLVSETSNIKNVLIEPDATAKLQIVNGIEAVRFGNQIILLKDSIVMKTKLPKVSSLYIDQTLGAVIEIAIDETSVRVLTTDIQTGNSIDALTSTGSYPKTLGAPDILSTRCRSKTPSQPPICRLLLSTVDGSIILLQHGKIKWTREEALTNIDAVEFLDLTLSDAEGELEEELANTDDVHILLSRGCLRDFYSENYWTNIACKNIFLHVIGAGSSPSASERAGLVRDDFGLHKLIVAVTKYGKVYGIDNISGKFHWIKYLPNFVGFNEEHGLQLFVQRTSKHYPLPAQCAIVGKHKTTGNGIIFQFNPINGQPVTGDGIIQLGYPIQQITLLPQMNSESFKGLVIMDNSNQVHVLPESDKKLADGLYMFTADRYTGNIAGYYVRYQNNALKTAPTWRIQVGSLGRQQKIIKIASKNPIEHAHSQGRVLADRSVLYKYLNPNLVGIVTQGNDPIHKFILNIHLVDVVSGAIIFSMTHRRAKGPVQIVHSENWLTYSFYNEKHRRSEVTTVELYEGKTQTNSTVWSSLGAPPLPLVERQAYILPANVVAMKETITEKGITNKHVLFGLASGNIVEMPWALLDPRRPSTNPERAREEGLIPYIPELPLPQEAMINYNQTVLELQGIHTAPSGLESTCLVIAYGLDIFVTRVTPSKSFDLLKEDFDYFLISAVLTALILASYLTKIMSSRKLVKQAWK